MLYKSGSSGPLGAIFYPTDLAGINFYILLPRAKKKSAEATPYAKSRTCEKIAYVKRPVTSSRPAFQ